MKRLRLATVLACAAIASAPVAALAQSAPHPAPLSRVLEMLGRRWPGKQLNTQMGDSGGRPTYVIRWQMAKDGRVVEIVVDAESGQVISGPAG